VILRRERLRRPPALLFSALFDADALPT